MDNKINNILTNEITKIAHTMLPVPFNGSGQQARAVREVLTEEVNRLGRHSATAQQLNKVITTAEKMSTSPSYILYLLKDAAANNGRGAAIGILKVGKKHLYLADSNGTTHEVEPVCILDFFVEADRQRCGLGKKLFDYMLQDLQIPPRHLAVDGPSPIMLEFLAKTYGLHNMVRHTNNFAVPATFFDDLTAVSNSSASTPVETPTGAGRYTAHQPRSAIGTIIHGHNSPDPQTSYSQMYRGDFHRFH